MPSVTKTPMASTDRCAPRGNAAFTVLGLADACAGDVERSMPPQVWACFQSGSKAGDTSEPSWRHFGRSDEDEA
eukprot:11128047-Alexandrium_andersonii.AAC.1